MDILVIGRRRREHAIVKKLKENPGVGTIYALPGNGGMTADAVCVPEIGTKDISAQVEFARRHQIWLCRGSAGRSAGAGRGGCAGRCRYSLLRPRSKGCRY